MRTVHEVSKLTRVSIRTLHYYDKIGLLTPAQVTEAGYRLYDDTNLERLQSILLFRELKFSLNEIKLILESSDSDRNKILSQQIELLKLQKEHLENLIDFACGIKAIGVKKLDFSVFDTSKIDEYASQVKAAWGQTEAYKEFEQKSGEWTTEDQKMISEEMMELFVEFGSMTEQNPADEKVQKQVIKLQDFITEHFYTCTKGILKTLGKMYSGGGTFTENIDKAGGKGTAEFVDRAIEIYCREQ